MARRKKTDDITATPAERPPIDTNSDEFKRAVDKAIEKELARREKVQIEGSTKFSVSLPGRIVTDLEQWARSEGRNRGNLAAHLLEMAVRIRFSDKYELPGYPPYQQPPADS